MGRNPDDFVPIHDPHTSDNKTTRATAWDPITGVHTEVRNNTNTDLFCAGSNHLADGSLFVAGGTKLYNRPINATQVFDFKTETWTLGPELKQPRWYPTVTDLADGTMLISGGRGANPELYEPSDKTLRGLAALRWVATGPFCVRPQMEPLCMREEMEMRTFIPLNLVV